VVAAAPAGSEAAPGRDAGAAVRDQDLWVYAGAGYSRGLGDGMPGGSIGLQAGLRYRLHLAPPLWLGGEAGYLRLGSGLRRRRLTEGVQVPGQTVYAWQDYSRTAVPVLLKLSWAPPAAAGRAAPAFAAGVGLYSLTDTWDNRPTPGAVPARHRTRNESRPGLHAAAGLNLGRRDAVFGFGLEAGIHHVFAEEEAWTILTLLGRYHL